MTRAVTEYPNRAAAEVCVSYQAGGNGRHSHKVARSAGKIPAGTYIGGF